MKIVLVYPNYDSSVIAPYLGIGYLSSSLKAKKIDVYVIDNLLKKYNFDTLISKIMEQKPDCVGISCLSSFYNEAKKISLKLKELGMKVIIGGIHTTFLPYTTLKETKCDFVICGEGEKAICDLLLNNFDNSNIKGVYKLNDLKSDYKVEFTEYIENLDELPFPDWDSINPNKYPKIPNGGTCKKFPVGIIMASRGCYGHCTFCASPALYKNKVRFRTPENVVEEIELLKYKYNIKEIHFQDDNILSNNEYAFKLFNLFIERKINLPWQIVNGIRADCITPELAKLMKRAGCYQVVIGVESANNIILKNVGKGETIEQIDNSISILYNNSLITRGNFIFGLPGETKETIENTISYAVNSKLNKAAFYVLDIVPGSLLWHSGKYTNKLNNSNTAFVKPNWIPENLTELDIQNALENAYKRFYSKPSRFFGMIKDTRIQQYPHIIHRLFKVGIFK